MLLLIYKGNIGIKVIIIIIIIYIIYITINFKSINCKYNNFVFFLVFWFFIIIIF